MSTVTLDLPYPPSANGLFANVAGRGRVRSDRYRQWANAAGWQLVSQKPGKVAGRYVLALEVERRDRRKRDLDNLLKAVSDLLVQHGVIEADHLAEHIHLAWGDVEGCRVTVAPYVAEVAA